MAKPTFVIALVLGVASGCGSHILLGALDEADAGSIGGDAAGRADTGTAPDAITGDPCADYANQFCEVEQSCNLLLFRNTFWGDMATCKERRKLRCELRLAAPGSNETPARIQACVAILRSLTCVTYGDRATWLESCEPPPGDLADGARCGVGAQCRGGGCVLPDNSLCSACTTPSPVGAPCNASCESILHCINGTCVAFLPEGSVCRFGGPLCAYGLACIGAGSGQGRCGPRLALGAACDPTAFECNDAQGLSCDGATRKCQVDPGLPAPGASCTAGQLCRADAWCNAGRCEKKRREGESCGNAAGSPSCLEPATCIGTTCTLPNPSGCR